MESTIGLYKTECITLGARGRYWSGLREVEYETAEWVRWYNHERIHSSIDYMTRIEREVVYADTIAQRGEVA
jgi:putative transposase